MQLIRVTGKLQKEMGLKKSDLCNAEPQFSYFGSWHANLIHISGKKCILFTNDRTLFNFLAPSVTRNHIRRLGNVFIYYFRYALEEEGFDISSLDKIVSEYSDIRYAKTNDKSVLGSMNDLAWHYKHHILDSGGIDSSDIPDIVKRLNRMPMSAIRYAYAIEAFKARANAT